MMVDRTDRQLIDAIADGLPLVPRPYRAIGMTLGVGEQDVIDRLRRLCECGVIRRFGVIVRHHELGYRANAMAAWDVPDEIVDQLGRRLAVEPAVTLCYRRRRARPAWPYNLFCMIHGRDRATVEAQLKGVAENAGLDGYPATVLFSRRRFKQRGADYRRHDLQAAVGGG